jgi:2-hydroxychromene-2-carboxylate isomerase
VSAKGEIRRARCDALGEYYGVPYSPNRSLLEALRQGFFKGDLFSRAAIAGQQLGVSKQINDALFGAVWAGSDDLASAEGRSRFATSRALPAGLWEVAESSEVDEKLIANNERAVARGVFGVPTFFVDDEMFFGNDRLSFVRIFQDVPGQTVFRLHHS